MAKKKELDASSVSEECRKCTRFARNDGACKGRGWVESNIRPCLAFQPLKTKGGGKGAEKTTRRNSRSNS
jgi:hypothetical protein